MRRILNQTWVKFALYMLIVMLFISFVILATVWYNFYGNNIAKNAECLDLAYRELKKAYESPLLERVAVKPYFALGKDKDAETVRYSSSGDCFYYEYDSKVMGSNIIIRKDSTLYY